MEKAVYPSPVDLNIKLAHHDVSYHVLCVVTYKRLLAAQGNVIDVTT